MGLLAPLSASGAIAGFVYLLLGLVPVTLANLLDVQEARPAFCSTFARRGPGRLTLDRGLAVARPALGATKGGVRVDSRDIETARTLNYDEPLQHRIGGMLAR